MARNKIFDRGVQLALVATDPAVPASGDPLLVGQMPGVALITEAADGKTTVDFEGVFTLSVKGIDQAGNSAVAAGDILYYVTADTPKISKKNTGVRFGYALEAVTSAATATIRVRLGY
jgi:predicted RecA/RadA family phage recombinase